MSLLGFERLQRAFERAPEFVGHELTVWMTAQGLYLQGEIQKRTPKDTGLLQKSIIAHVEYIGRLGVTSIIGTPLNYALPVEMGSKPHDILPKNGKALHFMMRGIPVFAKKVHHPGSKGAFMFKKSLDANITQIQEDFYRFVDHVLAKIASGAV